jgi:hypothetical protein
MSEYDKANQEVEKMLQYRFHGKERERSNHANYLREQTKGTSRGCSLNHSEVAWSGPPHDQIRAWVCRWCGAAACEPEVVDMGYEFDTVPDWIITQILDKDLKRQAEGGNKLFFGGMGGFNGKL